MPLHRLARRLVWAFDKLADLRLSGVPVARVSFNVRPVTGPWGGGNQWLDQIVRSLRRAGYSVRFDLRRQVDCAIIVDVAGRGELTWGLEELAELRRRDRRVACIHRVNECDKRKDTDFVDALLARADELADHTVFISQWLLDHHAGRWFDRRRPHTVIANGADPAVFHPLGNRPPAPGQPLRLVTHHWSDNPMKGFEEYRGIDRALAAGEISVSELWVIGRWPREITWAAARTFPPARGVALADLLRNCHVYVTASRWEPGGMHVIEGIQCGLPVLYHEDGGGIVEVARPLGIGYRNDLPGAIREMHRRYPQLRRCVLTTPPSGDRMCHEYRGLIQTAIALRRDNS